MGLFYGTETNKEDIFGYIRINNMEERQVKTLEEVIESHKNFEKILEEVSKRHGESLQKAIADTSSSTEVNTSTIGAILSTMMTMKNQNHVLIGLNDEYSKMLRMNDIQLTTALTQLIEVWGGMDLMGLLKKEEEN